MYEGAITSVRTICGETCEFLVTISLHKGSTLSPYPFTLIMDELTEVPWCMLFAYYKSYRNRIYELQLHLGCAKR